MFHVRINLDRYTADVRATRLALKRGLGVASVAAGRIGHATAKGSSAFQDRTGKLRAGITVSYQLLQGGAVEATIVAAAPHSLYVEAGTKAHEIWARDPHSKPLHFYWSKAGRWFRGPMARHPGTRPHPFMGPAYLKAEAVLWARTESAVATAAAIWR